MQNRNDNITQHTLQHSGGIIIVYNNQSEDETLKEIDMFNCDGLQLEGYDDMSRVELEIGPGERVALKLTPVGNGGYSYGISSQYSISS